MAELQVRKLKYEQAAEIYKQHLKVDFPPEEVKPLPVIRQAWEKQNYYAYGFYEEMQEGENKGREVLCAYAFFLADHKNQVLLLDYFAVCGPLRGTGYGSRALALLRQECSDWNAVIIEVEDDELPDLEEETRQTRRRRIAFYTNAGCRMTTTRSRLWGVDYRIMRLPLQGAGPEDRPQTDMPGGVVEAIRCLYEGMYEGKILRQHFEITAE